MALSHAAAIVSRLCIVFVCFFLAIAPQGNFFGILYLDSHISLIVSCAAVIVSRLYIFCVCFFLAIAPQGKCFFGYYIRIIDWNDNSVKRNSEKIEKQTSISLESRQ